MQKRSSENKSSGFSDDLFLKSANEMKTTHYKRAIKPGSSDKSFKIAKCGRVASCAAVCAPVGTATAGAFAFAAISKSWVVSPTIKVCEGSSPNSEHKAKTISGAGLDAYSLAQAVAIQKSAVPVCIIERSKPVRPLPVATASQKPCCFKVFKQGMASGNKVIL